MARAETSWVVGPLKPSGGHRNAGARSEAHHRQLQAEVRASVPQTQGLGAGTLMSSGAAGGDHAPVRPPSSLPAGPPVPPRLHKQQRSQVCGRQGCPRGPLAVALRSEWILCRPLERQAASFLPNLDGHLGWSSQGVGKAAPSLATARHSHHHGRPQRRDREALGSGGGRCSSPRLCPLEWVWVLGRYLVEGPHLCWVPLCPSAKANPLLPGLQALIRRPAGFQVGPACGPLCLWE